jgi:hypothetical protein
MTFSDQERSRLETELEFRRSAQIQADRS